jgi:hypothetical protein
MTGVMSLKFNKPQKKVRQSASYNLSVAFDAFEKDLLAVYYAEMAMAAGYPVKTDFMQTLRDKKAKQTGRK